MLEHLPRVRKWITTRAQTQFCSSVLFSNGDHVNLILSFCFFVFSFFSFSLLVTASPSFPRVPEKSGSWPTWSRVAPSSVGVTFAICCKGRPGRLHNASAANNRGGGGGGDGRLKKSCTREKLCSRENGKRFERFSKKISEDLRNNKIDDWWWDSNKRRKIG